MNLAQLESPIGARRNRKRVGRGPGSGHGKTACKGHKGQKARAGKKIKPGFEGGQMPLMRRLPKFGFTNIHRITANVLNLSDLNRFDDGAVVNLDTLKEKGLISKNVERVKLLGRGALEKKLTIKVFGCSQSAKVAVEKLGGTVESVG